MVLVCGLKCSKVIKLIGRVCHGKECLDLMFYHTSFVVSNDLGDFQELVKSLEVNPMELGGVKD